MTLLQRGLGFAQRWIPSTRAGTAVLAYHLVGARSGTVVDVTLEQFREQLNFIASECDVVPLATALAGRYGDRKAVVLTFDDAFRNFLELAWPELEKRRLPATLYVPVDFVRRRAGSPLRGASLPALTFSELRQLVAAGLSVGSHSVSHANLRRLAPPAVERELAESRQILEQELSVEVDSFCYPQAKLNWKVARAAARHYRSAVSAGGRPFSGRSHFAIPRFPVRADLRDFGAMVKSSLWLPESLSHRLRQHRP